MFMEMSIFVVVIRSLWLPGQVDYLLTIAHPARRALGTCEYLASNLRR